MWFGVMQFLKGGRDLWHHMTLEFLPITHYKGQGL